MSLNYDVATRNAKLDAIETSIGASPVLKIRTGSKPANCATADAGSVLASITLPVDWMAAAASGAKSKNAWDEVTATGAGTAGHFRIYDSLGACRIQGSFGTSGTDMIASSASFTIGQSFTILSFTLRDNNG